MMLAVNTQLICSPWETEKRWEGVSLPSLGPCGRRECSCGFVMGESPAGGNALALT